MIDFHSHTFFSDGVLSPAELIRRAYVKGYKIIGITDHVDISNMEMVFQSLKKIAIQFIDSEWDIKVIPGIEITHVPAHTIKSLTHEARDMGVPLVIVHGQTPVEPVDEKTNQAAIDAGVDILAHPGMISDEEVIESVKKGINLELTVRRGHSLTNGHVAQLAMKHNAKLVVDTDSHAPSDLFTPEMRKMVMTGSGLTTDFIETTELNIKSLAEKLIKKTLLLK